MEPPRVLWPDRSRGLLPPKQHRAGAMIPPEVLNRKSLFSLLYKIDLDLAERARNQRCPFAGVLCIAPTTCESLAVGPLIFKRLLSCVLACAAAVRVVGAVCYPHQCVFGVVEYTGHRCCCWSVLFGRGQIRLLPCSGSSHFAGYGVQPSGVGNATFVTFLLRASTTDAWLGT